MHNDNVTTFLRIPSFYDPADYLSLAARLSSSSLFFYTLPTLFDLICSRYIAPIGAHLYSTAVSLALSHVLAVLYEGNLPTISGPYSIHCLVLQYRRRTVVLLSPPIAVASLSLSLSPRRCFYRRRIAVPCTCRVRGIVMHSFDHRISVAQSCFHLNNSLFLERVCTITLV